LRSALSSIKVKTCRNRVDIVRDAEFVQLIERPPMPILDTLRRSRSALALLITVLYALLSAIALYVPISPTAPFSRVFGTPDLAREAVVHFVHMLFWPLAVFLLITAARELSRALVQHSRRG
jgi:hypothetical protein